MNTQHNIDFIKKVTSTDLAKLDKDSQDNYQELKSDTENFSDFNTIFEAVPDAEMMLDIWVQTAKKKGINPFEEKTTSVVSPKKEKVNSTVNKKAEEKQARLLQLREELKNEIRELKARVISHAELKEKIASELSKYLKSQPTGLSGTDLENEILKLKKQKTFYSNLLKGDKADFKAIAQRVGLDYRKSTLKAKKTLAGIAQKPKKGAIERFREWFNS